MACFPRIFMTQRYEKKRSMPHVRPPEGSILHPAAFRNATGEGPSKGPPRFVGVFGRATC